MNSSFAFRDDWLACDFCSKRHYRTMKGGIEMVFIKGYHVVQVPTSFSEGNMAHASSLLFFLSKNSSKDTVDPNTRRGPG